MLESYDILNITKTEIRRPRNRTAFENYVITNTAKTLVQNLIPPSDLRTMLF